jgi:hypothetical protein
LYLGGEVIPKDLALFFHKLFGVLSVNGELLLDISKPRQLCLVLALGGVSEFRLFLELRVSGIQLTLFRVDLLLACSDILVDVLQLVGGRSKIGRLRHQLCLDVLEIIVGAIE